MFEHLTDEYLAECIKPIEECRPYPAIDEREAWAALSEDLKERIIRNAEDCLDFSIGEATAVKFMKFFRTGSDGIYEPITGKRQRGLCALVLGECVENKGRFLDDIVNIIWAMCEETAWCYPSHNYVFPGRHSVDVGCLPDHTKDILDLGAGETGGIMAYTYYLLKPRLYDISPILTQRMEYELNRRIIRPFLEHTDYFWMALEEGFGGNVNNWTPWITANCLMTISLLEKDFEKRVQGVEKALKILEKFVATYGDDGGCDEGCHYWNCAAGSVFDNFEIILNMTCGELNLFDGNKKVKEMGRFIERMHIADNYYVCYADGDPIDNFMAQRIYKFGKYVDADDMKSMARSLFKQYQGALRVEYNLNQYLIAVFMYDELNHADITAMPEEDAVMPDLQAISFRDRATDFFLSAKGGHNNESHNHNDVGNYVIFRCGKPVIVDMGVSAYTKQCWGDLRYTIMAYRSSFHNLPEVNGFEQLAGEEFSAKGFAYEGGGSFSSLSQDISGAYPKEAGIICWNRSYTLNRGENIIIRDDFCLEKASSDIKINMITSINPIINEGVISIGDTNLTFDNNIFAVICEEIHLEDTRLRKNWGDFLYRLVFSVKYQVKQLDTKFIFTAH